MDQPSRKPAGWPPKRESVRQAYGEGSPSFGEPGRPLIQRAVGPEGSISALIATALLPLAASHPERYASLAGVLALMVGPASCSPL